jgi:8-oxo-dGTP diphosphatase
MKFLDWNKKEHILQEGREVLWRPAAWAVIEDNDKVLMTRTRSHGKWELPGGGVEVIEEMSVGLIREVKEEVGVVIEKTDINPIPAYFTEQFFYTLDTDEYFHSLVFAFQVKCDSTLPIEIFDTGEVAEARWIEKSELKNLDIHHITKDIFKHIYG